MKGKVMREIHNMFDKRIVKKFALFPIKTDTETRWLEFVVLEQEYSRWYGWLNKKFLNK